MITNANLFILIFIISASISILNLWSTTLSYLGQNPGAIDNKSTSSAGQVEFIRIINLIHIYGSNILPGYYANFNGPFTLVFDL